MINQKLIGIDIGATKMHVGVVDNGKVTDEVYVPTSSKAPEMQVVSELIEGIEKIFSKEVNGIGVGVPGLVDPDQGVVYDLWNIPSWKEVPLKKYLEEHFKIPVFLTNDANTFVLGEKTYGDGKPFRNMVGITLGSGFGTGIIIHNELYSGSYSSAGELADIPYLDGNIEDYCSGKFFRKKFEVNGSDLYKMAKENDEEALTILHEYGGHVGNAIKLILSILSPEAVFLGGSVSGSYEFFKEGLYEKVNTFPFKRVLNKLTIKPSQVKNISILGAAALVNMRQKKLK